MLTKMTLSHKIMAIFTTTIIIVSLVFFTAIPRINKAIIERSKQDLVEITTMASMLAQMLFTEASHKNTAIDKSRLIETWHRLSRTKGVYFTVLDTQGNLIYHPSHSDQNVADLQDARTGEYVLRTILEKVARAKQGEAIKGWQTFSTTISPNSKRPVLQDKLLYYSYLPENKWLVASIINQHDILKHYRNMLSKFAWIGLIIVIAWGLIVQLLSKNLSNNQEELDTIFHNSMIGMMLLHGGRKIARVNDRLADIFGYDSPEEMKEIPISDLHISATNYREFGTRYYNNLKKDEQLQVEYPFIRKDGTTIWCVISGKALDTAKPPDLEKGVIWTLDDITVKKAMQQELLLERERAEKSRQEAEQANRFKSDFLANMSHEIRTPMNAIIGMTYLLGKKGLTDEQQGYIKKIEGASNSLLGLINDILDLSKIEAGKMEIEHIPFDLHTVIENVCTLLEGKAIEKNLDFIVSYDPELTTMRIGDPLRLGQILINLTTNALKFTEQGEIGIYIDNRGKDLLRFEVRDTGIGLTPEQQDRLFQNFTQADASTTRKYGGTGLGLAITKRLVTLMGGQIKVESTVGHGSSFIFEIPLKKQQGEKQNLAFHNKKVLIVDDTPSWQEVIKRMLSPYDIDPDFAASGEEAIQMVCRNGFAYDLVFMDWHLPGIDGIEATRAIMEQCSKTPTTIIMISAYKKDTITQAAKNHGISCFLEKPINPSLLHSIIVNNLGNEVQKKLTGHSDKSPTLHQNISSLQGSTILLVEDNAINREILQGMLEDSGIIIQEAVNGIQAVEMYQANPKLYELILMDIQMPGMDGYEATKIIRQQDQAIPIIALSANAMPQEIRESSQAGMNEHLSKPIVVDKLFATLLQYISPKRESTKAIAPKQHSECSIDLTGFTVIQGEKALKNLLSDDRLYAKLLRDFAATYEHADQELTALLATDQSAAKRMVHTIKGLSGGIGAVELQEVSTRLEQSLSADQVPEFSRALAQAVQEIKNNSSLYPQETATDKAPMPDAIRKELCQQLFQLLKKRRPKQIQTVLDTWTSYALRPEDNDLLETLKKQIDQYNFTEALTLLEKNIHE